MVEHRHEYTRPRLVQPGATFDLQANAYEMMNQIDELKFNVKEKQYILDMEKADIVREAREEDAALEAAIQDQQAALQLRNAKQQEALACRTRTLGGKFAVLAAKVVDRWQDSVREELLRVHVECIRKDLQELAQRSEGLRELSKQRLLKEAVSKRQVPASNSFSSTSPCLGPPPSTPSAPSSQGVVTPATGMGKGTPPPGKALGKGKGPPLPGAAKEPATPATNNDSLASAMSNGHPPQPAGNGPPLSGTGKGPPLAKGKGPPMPETGKGPAAPATGKGLPPPGKGSPLSGTGKGPGLPKGSLAASEQAKGKGKGGSANAEPALPKSNGLVNIQWTGVKQPKDLERLRQQVFEKLLEAVGQELPELYMGNTAFNGAELAGNELTPAQLSKWFKKQPVEATVKTADPDGGGRSLLDQKLKMPVQLLIRKYCMKHNIAAGDDVVRHMQRAVLTCSHSQDALNQLLDMYRLHRETGSPVTQFVETHGVEKLAELASPDDHRLIHVVSKIPGIEHRLTCSIVSGNWAETARKSRADLLVLHEGMQVLISKREAHKQFFNTALRLGNSLNQDSRVPVASHGSTFRLSSLSKMLELRVPARPQATFLHVVLALMEPMHVEIISSGLSTLAAAKDRKSGGVYTNCTDVLKQFQDVQEKMEKVPRQKTLRRASEGNGSVVKCPSHRGFEGCEPLAEQMVEEVDPEDRFHERMRQFLVSMQSEAQNLAKLLQDVFGSYREEAAFFDDPSALWPPPMKDGDPAKDIFEFFFWFGEEVAKAAAVLKKLGLREDIQKESIPTAPLQEAAVEPGPRDSPPSCSGSAPQQRVSSAHGRPGMAHVGPAAGAVSSSASVPAAGNEAPDIAALRRLNQSNTSLGGSQASVGVRILPERKSRSSSVDSTQSDVSDWEDSSPKKNKKKVAAAAAGRASHGVALHRWAPAEAAEGQKPAVPAPSAAESVMRRLQSDKTQTPVRASTSASSPSRPSVMSARGAGARIRSESRQSDVSDWSPSPPRKRGTNPTPASETPVVRSVSSAALPRPPSPRQPHSPGRPKLPDEGQALLQPSPPPRPAMTRALSASRLPILAARAVSPSSSRASASGAILATPVRATVSAAVEAVSSPRFGEAILAAFPPPPKRSVSRAGLRQSHSRATTPVRSGTPQGLETPQRSETPQSVCPSNPPQWSGRLKPPASSATPPPRSLTPPRRPVMSQACMATSQPSPSASPPSPRSPLPVRVMSSPVHGSDDSPTSLPCRAQSSYLDSRGIEAQMRRKSLIANADRLCQEALRQFRTEVDPSDSEAADIERDLTSDESDVADEREAEAHDDCKGEVHEERHVEAEERCRKELCEEREECEDDDLDCASCCSFETGVEELTMTELPAIEPTTGSNSPNRRRKWGSSSGAPPPMLRGGFATASPSGGAFHTSDLSLTLGLPPRRPPSRTPSCDGQIWHTGRESFTAELKSEVRRRSLSRGSVRTPVRSTSSIHQIDMGLTPVAEPGETPGRPGLTPGRMSRSASRPPSSRTVERCAAIVDTDAELLCSSQKLRPEATYDKLGRSSPRRLFP